MNLFSFFAGAGFLDLGFETTGHYNVVYVNEYHEPFNKIYKYSREKMGIAPPIYGHHIIDISSLLEEPQLSEMRKLVERAKQDNLTGFIGGPPCPDFSVAGKNRGRDGENGKLSGSYVDLICKLQPDFFLFENVKGLYRTKRHRLFFEELKSKLVECGYYLTEQLVNSLEFGVPQDRDRIILIGIHEGTILEKNIPVMPGIIVGFPWDLHKKYNKEEILQKNWPTQDPYAEGSCKNTPNGIIEDLTVQYWWNKNDIRNHPNQNMFFIPKAAKTIFDNKCEGDVDKKCYKRLHRHRFSPTAAYGNNEVHIHPYEPRRISVAEALAIQSLPKEYEIPYDATLTNAFKTIGNGVPYLTAVGIAKSLADFLEV